MSEFKVIESQEELNEVIGERIKRAEENVRKEFSNYADIKKNLEDKTKELEDTRALLGEAQEKNTKHDEEVEGLNAKIKEYETASVKASIANEFKLPYDAVNFLQGEDEESIRKSAESLKKMVGDGKPAPIDKLDPMDKTKVSEKEAYKKLAGELFED